MASSFKTAGAILEIFGLPETDTQYCTSKSAVYQQSYGIYNDVYRGQTCMQTEISCVYAVTSNHMH
jgi:hypothetical protein